MAVFAFREGYDIGGMGFKDVDSKKRLVASGGLFLRVCYLHLGYC